MAPYFEGTGEESLNPNAETKFRISVIAVIKNEKDNTYLCVDALKRNCKSFVLGGIEEGDGIMINSGKLNGKLRSDVIV